MDDWDEIRELRARIVDLEQDVKYLRDIIKALLHSEPDDSEPKKFNLLEID